MKNFCLTVPKIFVEEPFFALQNFWYRKNLWTRGGQKGVSRFFVQIFLSDSAWKFRMGTHQCVINFGYRKILGFREFCHDFVSKILSHSAEKFRRETFLICASENFWSRKKIRIRRGGNITIFCQNFLSDIAEKLRRGTHQCVINFGYRKILGFREFCHDFVSKILSHSAEKFRRETFLICASENFWSRKKIRIRRGGNITIFCQNFLSDIAEKLRRGTHQCVINFGFRKILGFRELCHVFVSKFLSHSAENFRRETFLICASEKFWSRKKIRIRGGGGNITIFCQNFLTDSPEKLRRGTHQCVINFGFRKILGFRELCHDFLSKILSHSAEKFRRETFLICASENFWSRKKIRIRGGGKYHDFLSKLFVWQCRKTS